MGAITKRLVLLLCLFAAGVLFSLYFGFFWEPVPALFCSLAAAALLLMLPRQWAQWGMARLILDSQILQVCSATVSSRQGSSGQWKPEISSQITVSTFGILMNDRAYKWGCDGIKLETAGIDHDTLSLTFRDTERVYSVKLLHGIRELAEVDSLAEKLRYETGVLPVVCR